MLDLQKEPEHEPVPDNVIPGYRIWCPNDPIDQGRPRWRWCRVWDDALRWSPTTARW